MKFPKITSIILISKLQFFNFLKKCMFDIFIFSKMENAFFKSKIQFLKKRKDLHSLLKLWPPSSSALATVGASQQGKGYQVYFSWFLDEIKSKLLTASEQAGHVPRVSGVLLSVSSWESSQITHAHPPMGSIRQLFFQKEVPMTIKLMVLYTIFQWIYNYLVLVVLNSQFPIYGILLFTNWVFI